MNGENHDHVEVVDWDDVDAIAVSKVGNRVELTDVRLRMHHSEVNAAELPTGWPKKAFVLWTPHLGDRGEESFEAHITFIARLKGGFDPEGGDEPPEYDPDDPPDFEMAAFFSLLYELRDGESVSNDELEHFCRYNSTVNVWPYWRELAHSTTLRMGIEPLHVGILPVPSLTPRAPEASTTPLPRQPATG